MHTFSMLRLARLVYALLLLVVLAAPSRAAGLAITKATIGPSTLPLIGGVITVSATVTDTAKPVTGVTAVVSRDSAYYDPSDDRRTDTITLYSSGGSVYTGSIPSAGTNTSGTAYTYTAVVTATDGTSTPSLNATGSVVQAAGSGAPVVSNAQVVTTTLPVDGGGITVSATVTDPGKRAISTVQATVLLNGANYNPNNDYHNSNTITLSSSGGGVYTGTLATQGANTTASPYKYTAMVRATNDLNLSGMGYASGAAVQANDNQPPVVANIVLSPSTIAYAGGTIRVTTTITDPGKRAIKGVQATVLLGGENYNPNSDYHNSNTITLSSSGNGIYTGTLATYQTNTDTFNYVYTASVTATNDLNLSGSGFSAGQAVQVSKGPTGGSVPFLYTTSASKPVLSPASAAAGSDTLTLTINGGNFMDGATVLFNGVTIKPISIKSTQVVVVVPATLLTTPGAASVSVANPTPNGVTGAFNFTSNTVNFMIN